jgi:hypothetical protein
MNAPVKISDQDANMLARNAVLSRSINMWQSIASGTVAGATARGTVINVPIRNVGLLKRLVLEIQCTIIQAAAETLTLTKFGPSNFISQAVLTDLNNQTRIQTSGWHLHTVASARRQMVFGAAYTNDSPVSMGNNFNTITATASVTNSAKTIRMFYEIPIAYGDYDLRGAIFANVVNATMNFQFTINNNFVVANTGDPTLAVYQSSSTDLGTLGTVSWNVYQNYLDQLPMGNRGPVVPILDLSTAYLLNNTSATGLTSGQDFPLPYANFRNFMSTTVIYDNGGTLNVGTDVNYWALQSANYTNILKIDPLLSSLLTRQILGDDMPPGTYYFDHRQKPISTIQYGNMQLVVNPAGTVNAGAQLLTGYESLALINQLTGAGSLYAN